MPDLLDLHSLPRRYQAARQLCAEPAICLLDDFASAAELQALREAAREHLAPAKVSGDKRGYISSGRSGSNCWLAHDYSPETLAVAERISALVRIPLAHAESFQVVHYGPGEEYKAHYDAWDADTERGQRCMSRGGQRLVTTLLYLNEVNAGGGTAFPRLQLQVDPQPGQLLIFHNCRPGSNEKHPATLHGGLPVTSGEKWAVNLWFREFALRA